MPNLSPVTSLDARYSEENAQPTPWPDAVTHLERAGLFWVSSVRADGRPHVTPVVAVWTPRRRRGSYTFVSVRPSSD